MRRVLDDTSHPLSLSAIAAPVVTSQMTKLHDLRLGRAFRLGSVELLQRLGGHGRQAHRAHRAHQGDVLALVTRHELGRSAAGWPRGNRVSTTRRPATSRPISPATVISAPRLGAQHRTDAATRGRPRASHCRGTRWQRLRVAQAHQGPLAEGQHPPRHVREAPRSAASQNAG